MNYRGGVALVKRSMLRYLSQRGFFWTLSLAWMMGPLIYLFVWLTAAKEKDIGGFTGDEFILYYLFLILVNQLTYPSSHWTTGESIQNGTLSVWLLRPVSPIYEAIASDIAVKIVCLPFVLVFVIGLGIILNAQLTMSGSNMGLFIFSLIVAQILRFTFSYILSLIAFWTDKINALLLLNDTFIFLFAGQVAPTALLPDYLRELSELLPFRYMLGFSIEVLMGKLTLEALIKGFVIQITWVVIVLSLYRVIWKKGIKSYTAVGG